MISGSELKKRDRPIVFFLSVEDHRKLELVKPKFKLLIRQARILEGLAKDEIVAIKLTFGEKDNKGFINPEIVKVLIEEIKMKGAHPYLTDTSVIYKGSRMNAVEHLMLAFEHGFSIENLGAPIVIADGLLGEDSREVRIDKRHIQSAKIAASSYFIENLISISHLTGHLFTGFAATIKNIGMGLASKAGKQIQHSNIKPSVIKQRCTFCQLCLKACPVSAITELDHKACIDKEICIGCADCLVACKFDAIEVSWQESVKVLCEKMAEYALASLLNKKYKFFINFAYHITRDCDCLAKDDPLELKDLGIFASDDPVAVDKATVDMAIDVGGEDIFKKWHPDSHCYLEALTYAQEIGLGSLEYELIKIKE